MADVNCGETDLAENAVHLRLGGCIVSRHEQHTMSTGFVRIGSQNLMEQSVGGFYDASAGSQRCHNLTRCAAIQIGDLKVHIPSTVGSFQPRVLSSPRYDRSSWKVVSSFQRAV